jgi:hypothetical protein
LAGSWSKWFETSDVSAWKSSRGERLNQRSTIVSAEFQSNPSPGHFTLATIEGDGQSKAFAPDPIGSLVFWLSSCRQRSDKG